MEFELSRIDAAVEQPDWAIRLFLDHKANVPARASLFLGYLRVGRICSNKGENLHRHFLSDVSAFMLSSRTVLKQLDRIKQKQTEMLNVLLSGYWS